MGREGNERGEMGWEGRGRDLPPLFRSHFKPCIGRICIIRVSLLVSGLLLLHLVTASEAVTFRRPSPLTYSFNHKPRALSNLCVTIAYCT